jgi:hypothetical protein
MVGWLSPCTKLWQIRTPSGHTTFDVAFEEDVDLTGYMKARLWVEADGHDEMDLFLTVLKLDEKREWLPTSVMGQPHPGAWGRLRVSQRALDPELSTDFQPVQSHRKRENLRPGEIEKKHGAFANLGGRPRNEKAS